MYFLCCDDWLFYLQISGILIADHIFLAVGEFLCCWLIIRLRRFLPPKMPFFICQKVQISLKILPQLPNFASFSPSENEALSAVYNWYCC